MKLKLSAKAYLEEKSSWSGLTGDVFRIDENDKASFVRQITLPIMDYNSDRFKVIDELGDAKPGKYILQTWLPNGDVRSDRFELKEGEDTELAILIPHEGPHEWTSLHALTGQFQQEFIETQGFSKALSDTYRPYSDMSSHPQQGFALRVLKPEEGANESIFSGQETYAGLLNLFGEDSDLQSVVSRLNFGPDVTDATMEDSDFAIFRFEHCGLLQKGEQDNVQYPFGPGTPLDRHYLLQLSTTGGKLVCLPTPWTTPYGQAEVELLLKKNTIDAIPEVAVTITEPMINTILGYINSGAIHRAAELITYDKAKDWLYDKISYPLTALVGGYLLILGIDRERYKSQSDNWKNWIDNLDHWFEWMPDSAILNAALYFILDSTDKDRAFDALMRAYHRGLPFFTFGLKLLLDGMRYFAREGETKAKEYLKVLEVIANQADPSQPFLSLSFPQKW